MRITFSLLALLLTVWSHDIVAAESGNDFKRVGKIEVKGNAEIISPDPTGQFVAITNATKRSVDLIDISDAKNPTFLTSVQLPGEPTSVAVSANGKWILAVVYAGKPCPGEPQTYLDRPGILALINASVPENAWLTSIKSIGHHPDSIAIASAADADRMLAVIAIENEPVVVHQGIVLKMDRPGQGDDLSSSGHIEIVAVNPSNAPETWQRSVLTLGNDLLREHNLLFTDDAQPEYVAISPDQKTAAISLQENNGIVIVDLDSRQIKNIFSLGKAKTRLTDLQADGKINLTERYPESVADEPLAGTRFPDAITFSPDGEHIISADEGALPLTGGRGISLWSTTGKFIWDDGGTIERHAAANNLYLDDRSDKKGVEIEGVASAIMNGRDYVFAVGERGSFLVIYDISNPAKPQFVQLLPTGKEPEGVATVPSRNLVIVATKKSSAVELFRLQNNSSE